jgi:signal transduction histidine kinase
MPAILGNEDTLYLIFKNLVENAIKFTQSGTVYVNARQIERTIRVEVRDEGIGIPVQAMPNLFKRFYRAQTAVERGIAGTGLGLYMVKEGVEKHSGTIDVESEEGVGTTFVVHLPVAQL